MLKLEEIVGLPQAGRALLVAHRWLQAQGIAGSAFDALHNLTLIGLGDDQIPGMVEVIAENDYRGPLILLLAHQMATLDRHLSTLKALGDDEEARRLQQTMAAHYSEFLRSIRGEGGQS